MGGTAAWLTTHAARRSRTQSGINPTTRDMKRLADIACLLLVAGAFAAISHQAITQYEPTHSGNQNYVRR